MDSSEDDGNNPIDMNYKKTDCHWEVVTDVTNIMDEYIAEQNVLGSITRQLIASFKDPFRAGPSRHRSGPRMCIQRDHEAAHQCLVADYFAEDPLYSERMFRTRFRMRRDLLLRIVSALGEWSPYFTQRADCSNRQGLSPLQKHISNSHVSIWYSC